MSERALEFVETWVSEKIEEMEELPARTTRRRPKHWRTNAEAALEDGIPAAEIQEAFDNLAEFIGGEIEEERERREGTDKDEDANEELKWEAEDDVEDEEDNEDDKEDKSARHGVGDGVVSVSGDW